MEKKITYIYIVFIILSCRIYASNTDSLQRKVFDGIVLIETSRYEFHLYFDGYYNFISSGGDKNPWWSTDLVRMDSRPIPLEEYSDTCLYALRDIKYRYMLSTPQIFPITFGIIQWGKENLVYDAVGLKNISGEDIEKQFTYHLSKSVFFIDLNTKRIFRKLKVKLIAVKIPREMWPLFVKNKWTEPNHPSSDWDRLYIVERFLRIEDSLEFNMFKPYFPEAINVKTFQELGRYNVNYLLRSDIFDIIKKYNISRFDLEWRSTHGESLVVYKDVKENPGEPIEAPKGQKFLLSVSKYEKNLLHVFIFNEKKELQAIGWISQSNNLQYCVNNGETIVYNKINGKEQDIIGSDGNNKTVQFLKVKNGWFKIKYNSKNKDVRTGWICNKDNKE